MRKNTFCSFCGHRHIVSAWPRQCPQCSNTTYLNPIPAVVCLAPVNAYDFLTIRRAIEPQVGGLCLPGGYMDVGETYQQCASREVFEEAGVLIDSEDIHLYDVITEDGHLIIFTTTSPMLLEKDLPVFKPNEEVSERLILPGADFNKLCFDTHQKIVKRFYDI